MTSLGMRSVGLSRWSHELIARSYVPRCHTVLERNGFSRSKLHVYRNIFAGYLRGHCIVILCIVFTSYCQWHLYYLMGVAMQTRENRVTQSHVRWVLPNWSNRTCLRSMTIMTIWPTLRPQCGNLFNMLVITERSHVLYSIFNDGHCPFSMDIKNDVISISV